MKVYTKITVVLMAFALSACENWLDLKPVDQATEGQIFSNSEGYRSTLNGLYKSMGKADLYGRALSFGFIDCISQQYDMNDEFNTNKMVKAMGKFQYNDVGVADVIDDMWLRAYNIIANANNLIQNIKTTTPDFFRQGKMEQDMILGEAYACRGLMHFDMLRVFAPALANDDGRSYIPYVEQYPNIQASGTTVTDCLNKVIADLEMARELVMTFDTSAYAMNAVCTGGGRFYNDFPRFTELSTYPGRLEDFFKGRGYRLNYYSITALLARVYQYAREYEKSFECAKAVMEFKYEASEWDKFTFYEFSADGVMSGEDGRTASFEAKRDLRLVNNLIFAVYNEKAYDELGIEDFFEKSLGGHYPQYLVINKERQHVFDVPTSGGTVDESGDDIRYAKMIYLANDRVPVSGKWFYHEDLAARNMNVTVLPVIRATEMQYIMAEHYARLGNFADAKRILEDIRRERGCQEPLSINSWEEFRDELIREARREWISEGQLFYLYKRLDAPVDFSDGTPRKLKRQEAVVPMPDNQAV